MLRKRVEQGAIDRRIAYSHVINLLDDAAAEEMGPYDVGQILGEVRIVVRNNPHSQQLPAIAALAIGRGAAQELWRHYAAADEMIHLAATRIEHDRLARIGTLLTANLREECGKAV